MDMRCCARIDMDAAKQNYRVLRGMVHPHTRFLCVVKANAYGHGIVEMARLWESLGADMLAVATADEALALRHGGIHAPCLILGYAPHTMARCFYNANILPTIYGVEEAAAWEQSAAEEALSLPCHIKINTGMNRIGLSYTDAEALRYICSLPHLYPCGIYSHLATVDTDPAATQQQVARFESISKTAEGICCRPLTRHIANTEAILRVPEAQFDMVRAGIGLYGYTAGAKNVLCPVMQAETRIVQTQALPRGAHVGYGSCHRVKRSTRIATLSMGYADGLRRDSALHHVGFTIHGKYCPVIGNVCMDMCMVDIGAVSTHIKAGDTAILFGYPPAADADALARAYRTIPYEILTSLSARVMRVYETDDCLDSPPPQ